MFTGSFYKTKKAATN